jgi:hypothetical protein
MMVRLLKSYVMRTGKKMPMGAVFNRRRKEAEKMIVDGIAMAYQGGMPPKKMKTNLFNQNANIRNSRG